VTKPRVRIPVRTKAIAGFTRGEMKAFASVMSHYVLNGGDYDGASDDEEAFKNWSTHPGSGDGDTLGALSTLRSRSRNLDHNDPIAHGTLGRLTTNVVNTGLTLRSDVVEEVLGISGEQAEAFQRRAELLFGLWANSTLCDASRATNFAGLQQIVYRSSRASGDSFTMRRHLPGPRAFVGLALQIIEADRVANPPTVPATLDCAAGIRVDPHGAPLGFYVSDFHPGDRLGTPGMGEDFTYIPAIGPESGEPLILHHRKKTRSGTRRGVPYLAAVIKLLKQLKRYADAELMAAVLSAFFTVFVKTPHGNGGDLEKAEDADTSLGPGAIVNLAQGEDITFANPARPNAQFDPFFIAVVRQIGIALEIPYEVLLGHFTASYSASRAALETAWQFFRTERAWLAASFCQPVYEWFVAECVALGLLDAPGFFIDPIARAAWCGAEWIGPARISLDPKKEAEANEIYEAHGWKTAQEITAETTGGDWRRKNAVRGREVAARREAGLESVAPIGDNGGPPLDAADPDAQDKEERG